MFARSFSIQVPYLILLLSHTLYHIWYTNATDSVHKSIYNKLNLRAQTSIGSFYERILGPPTAPPLKRQGLEGRTA